MSKIFYDHLIVLEEIEAEIKNSAQTEEERHELWQLVDEIVHTRIMENILDRLPGEHHNEFLEKFHAAPHDDGLLDYLKEKIEENIEELLKEEIGDLAYEILGEIRGKVVKE